MTATAAPHESVVILGSSRSDGNTSRAVDAALTHTHVEVIDLGPLGIGHYDPEGFESPFRLSCAYLGMQYIGSHHVQIEDDMSAQQLRSRVGHLAWITEYPA